jgi:aminomethyltransferase
MRFIAPLFLFAEVFTMTAPQRTPLFESHVAAGGKMVDFAGWEMPINYGSQIEEHHAVRKDAGMFDVSHMCALDLAGPGALPFLRHLLANDCAKLTLPGKALYSAMLNPEAGVIDDLIVYFFTPERYRIVVNAGTADKDIAWMREQIKGSSGSFDAALTVRRDLAMIAVQGPNARERFWSAFPVSRANTVMLENFQAADWAAEDGTWMIARTGYTGEDGFEITLPADYAATAWKALLDVGVKPAGLGARDTLRLEAGMNLYGQDMDESVSPYEAGMKWTVDLKDASRDFIGKSALVGENARPCTVRFAGLLLLDKGVLRAHQKVFTALGNGEITSGSFSPTLQQSIALARIPAGVENGTVVEVEIRDKKLKARVIKPSFARNGASLI